MPTFPPLPELAPLLAARATTALDGAGAVRGVAIIGSNGKTQAPSEHGTPGDPTDRTLPTPHDMPTRAPGRRPIR